MTRGIKEKAFDELDEPLLRVLRVLRCITAMQLALVGMTQWDGSDSDIQSALLLLADEAEESIKLARATWSEADAKAAA